jgi:hypothetical protein
MCNFITTHRKVDFRIICALGPGELLPHYNCQLSVFQCFLLYSSTGEGKNPGEDLGCKDKAGLHLSRFPFITGHLNYVDDRISLTSLTIPTYISQ